MLTKDKKLKLANFRIFFFLAIALMSGIFLANSCNSIELFVVFLIIAIIFCIAAYFYCNIRYMALGTYAFAIIGVLLFSISMLNVPVYDKAWKSGVEVSGRICELPYEYQDNIQFAIDNIEITSGIQSIKLDKKMNMIVSVNAMSSYKYGDEIKANANVYIYKTADNPLEPNYYLTSLAKGGAYYSFADSKNITVTGNKSDLYGFFISIKKQIIQNIDEATGTKEAPMLEAMTVGEKGGIDVETTNVFSDVGLSHLLAVAGLHLGFLVLVLRKLLQALKIKKYYLLCIMLIFIISYCAITAFAVSVMRASLVLSIILLTEAMGKRYDALNALGMAAIILLLINPLQLFTISFQLSFCACMGIVLFQNLFTHKNKYINNALAALNITIGASLLTLPLIIFYFNKVSLISLFANFLLVPFGSLIIGSSFFSSLLALINHSFGIMILGYVGSAAKVFYDILLWLSNLQYSKVYIPTPPIWALFAYLITAFFASRFIILKQKTKGLISLTIALVYVLVITVPIILPSDKITVTVLSVENAMCIHIHTPNNKNYLIDTAKSQVYSGGDSASAESVVLPYLQRMGITKLDGVFISHEDSDHCGGLYVLNGQINISNIYYPLLHTYSSNFNDLLNKYQNSGTELHTLSQDDSFYLDGMLFYILNPPINTGSAVDNDNSLVIRLTYGYDSIIFPADISANVENQIIAQYQLTCDILIASHHGSNGSSSPQWLDELHPNSAVFSQGGLYEENISKTLVRMNERNIKVYDTNENGAVIFYVSLKNGISVKTMR